MMWNKLWNPLSDKELISHYDRMRDYVANEIRDNKEFYLTEKDIPDDIVNFYTWNDMYVGPSTKLEFSEMALYLSFEIVKRFKEYVAKQN